MLIDFGAVWPVAVGQRGGEKKRNGGRERERYSTEICDLRMEHPTPNITRVFNFK